MHINGTHTKANIHFQISVIAVHMKMHERHAEHHHRCHKYGTTSDMASVENATRLNIRRFLAIYLSHESSRLTALHGSVFQLVSVMISVSRTPELTESSCLAWGLCRFVLQVQAEASPWTEIHENHQKSGFLETSLIQAEGKHWGRVWHTTISK